MAISTQVKSPFRYDINALRAIAVLAVLFFHYKVELLAGGFAGVDIFFVISGYLMTRIIMNAIDGNKFSYWDYLGKRFKRIVPALLFLILILLITCFFLYFPEDYKLSQKYSAVGIAFISNINYWLNSDYFAPSSESNILLHTWSLSVEWQFYMIYPIALVILSKIMKNRRLLATLFTVATLLIFLATIVVSEREPGFSFYMLPTRSWEMMFGGIAFFQEDLIKNLKWRKYAAIIGYLLILASILMARETMNWPGSYTMLPVLATFLVIIANQNDYKILSSGIVQFFGKISYSLYLWHWPVFVIAQYYGAGTSWLAICMYTLLAVAFGYLSFRYLESINYKSYKPILAAMALLFICTAGLSRFNSNTVLFKESTLAIESYSHIHKAGSPQYAPAVKQYSRGTCHITAMKQFNKEKCLCFVEGKKNILLIGDSHLAHLSQSLKEKLGEKNISVMQATASGTIPTVKNYNIKKTDGSKLMDFIYQDFIPKNAAKIDGVIISASWAKPNWKPQPPMDSVAAGIKEAVAYLNKFGIKTIVIGQTERYTIPYSTIKARENEYNTRNSQYYIEEYPFELNAFLSKALKPVYINVINSGPVPSLSAKGEPYMSDEHHVTKYGADLIADKILADPIGKKFIQEL